MKRISPALALLFAVWLMLPVSAQPTIHQNLSSVHIPKFARVNDHYYRGGQPHDGDFMALAHLGIKTVINLVRDFDPNEKAEVEKSGMKYVGIPMTTHQPPTAAEVAQFLQIVNDPKNQPVYVHCSEGIHRTGLMTAVYRMTQEAWTADQAYQEMKYFGYGFDFLHPEFKSFVYDYYNHLRNTHTSVSVTNHKRGF